MAKRCCTAWNPSTDHGDAQTRFLRDGSAINFGPAVADDVAAVMNDYFRLAAQRKPEAIAAGVSKPNA